MQFMAFCNWLLKPSVMFLCLFMLQQVSVHHSFLFLNNQLQEEFPHGLARLLGLATARPGFIPGYRAEIRKLLDNSQK